MDIRVKMRRDWDRRARVDPQYWVAATEQADASSYEASAEKDARALLEGLPESLLSEPGARVLDLGCGIGRLASLLSARFEQLVGVDVSEEMIAEARRRHPGLSFQLNSGADLAAFPDACFDLVYCYSVLPHLPPDVVTAYFHEVRRVLKPGGLFRFQFWFQESPGERPAANDTLSIRVYGEDELQRLHAGAGLEIERVTEIDYLDPVLECRPVWINARAAGPAGATPGPLAPAAETTSVDEQELEYGLLLYLAVRHADRGERDDAERVLEQATAIDPRRPEAWVQWGGCRLQRDDVRGARLLFEALTENAPECPHGWAYLALADLTLEDEPGARAAMCALDALQPLPDELEEFAGILRETLEGDLSS